MPSYPTVGWDEVKDLVEIAMRVNYKDRYKVYKIPKPGKPGEFRQIEAPCEQVKRAQRALLPWMYQCIRVSPFCHGFVPRDDREGITKGMFSMAEPHTDKDWVVGFDFSNFFPSISKRLIDKARLGLKAARNKQGMRTRRGQSIWRQAAQVCFHDFNDGMGPRLPQGAPTSPWLANALMREFDERVAKICNRKGVAYSRYADDLAFSGNDADMNPEFTRWVVDKLLIKCGLNANLMLNHKKTRVLRRGSRQLVCGLVVNGTGPDTLPRLPRKFRKNLKTAEFQGDTSLRTKGRQALLSMIAKHQADPHQELRPEMVIRLRTLKAAFATSGDTP